MSFALFLIGLALLVGGVAWGMVTAGIPALYVGITCVIILGIGIIAAMAYNPSRDTGLRLLDSAHLFENNTTWIAVRKGHYLRNFAYQFIALCNPQLNEPIVRSASSLSASIDLDR